MASSTSPAAPAKGMIQSPANPNLPGCRACRPGTPRSNTHDPYKPPANPHPSSCRERACPFRAAAPTTWNDVGRIRNTFANSPNVGVCRSVCRRKGSGCGFARRDPKTDVLLRGTPRTAFPTGGCHIIKKAPASPIPPAQGPRRRRKAQKTEKTLLHILENSGIIQKGSAISGRTWRVAARHAPVQSDRTTQHSRTKRLRRTLIIPARPPVCKRPVCFWRICLCVITLISGGVECFSQGTLDAAVCVSGQGPRAGGTPRPWAAGRRRDETRGRIQE